MSMRVLFCAGWRTEGGQVCGQGGVPAVATTVSLCIACADPSICVFCCLGNLWRRADWDGLCPCRVYVANRKYILIAAAIQGVLAAWGLLLTVTAGTQPLIASASLS